MSISSVNLPSAYQYTPPVASVGTPASPVVQNNDPGLAQQVGALSTTAGVVATLGSAPASTQTYDAAGLYNSIAQAGTSTAPALTAPAAANAASAPSVAQQSLNSAIVSSLPNSAVNSGFYTGTGTLQSAEPTGANLTSNWASALQANPNLAHTVAADSYAQGIIGTLSVTV
ncbi:MAG: hypothetical protein JO269_05540 [Burkholderiaceae bacterium]|nr:hypothetical protein [Burkholderiaceae bacterium]